MLKQCGSRSVVRTEERIGRNVVKTGVTRGKMAIMMAYAKARKMHAQEGVRMLKQRVIIEEPEAKIISARDRLTVPDLFKATTKVTTETIVAVIVIAADTNK